MEPESPLISNSRLLKVKCKPKHKRALRRESTGSTEACAEPKEVVAEPLPAKSGTIAAEEEALLAMYYADFGTVEAANKESIHRGSLGPNTLCWIHCPQRLC